MLLDTTFHLLVTVSINLAYLTGGLSLGNITFQQLDTDISAIIPSPINSRDSSGIKWITDIVCRRNVSPCLHSPHQPSDSVDCAVL